MGIDAHSLNWLRYAKSKYHDFGKTITIGRQELHVPESVLRAALRLDSSYENDKYCELLLRDHFGSSVVDSMDNSGYENASIIHDMNQPLPPAVGCEYDTVLDIGCLEHIYNAPQALRNCSLLCKAGGQIIHALPANNFCGHGFWQFSPELFFSLYSSENGYADTEVFLADLADLDRWFKVKRPGNGQRINISSRTPVYVLVRTILEGTDFAHDHVQQSDYVYNWTNRPQRSNLQKPDTPGTKKTMRQSIKALPSVYRLLSPFYHRYLRYWNQRTYSAQSRLSDSHPGLTELSIRSLLA